MQTAFSAFLASLCFSRSRSKDRRHLIQPSSSDAAPASVCTTTLNVVNAVGVWLDDVCPELLPRLGGRGLPKRVGSPSSRFDQRLLEFVSFLLLVTEKQQPQLEAKPPPQLQLPSLAVRARCLPPGLSFTRVVPSPRSQAADIVGVRSHASFPFSFVPCPCGVLRPSASIFPISSCYRVPCCSYRNGDSGCSSKAFRCSPVRLLYALHFQSHRRCRHRPKSFFPNERLRTR